MRLWTYLETLHNARAHVNPARHQPVAERSVPLDPQDWLIDLSPGASYEGKDDVKMYLRLLGRASDPSLITETTQVEAGRAYLAEEMSGDRGVFVHPSDLITTPHNALHNPFYLSTRPDHKPKPWTDLEPRGWWYFTSLPGVLPRARCFMDKQGGRPGEKFVMTRSTNVTSFRAIQPGLTHEFVKTNIRAPLLPGVTPPSPTSDRFALLISQLYRTNIHPALRYHFLCVADIEEIEEHMDFMLDTFNFYDVPSVWPQSGRPGIIMRGWYPQSLDPNESWNDVDKNRVVFLDGWTRDARAKRAKEIEKVRRLNADDDMDPAAEKEAKRVRLRRELG